MEIGLLLLRLTAGLTLAAHGAQKLFGWFGGPGLDATGQYFETLGFLPGRRHALMAGLAARGRPPSGTRLIHADWGCAHLQRDARGCGREHQKGLLRSERWLRVRACT
jgi:hypothetical protein